MATCIYVMVEGGRRRLRGRRTVRRADSTSRKLPAAFGIWISSPHESAQEEPARTVTVMATPPTTRRPEATTWFVSHDPNDPFSRIGVDKHKPPPSRWDVAKYWSGSSWQRDALVNELWNCDNIDYSDCRANKWAPEFPSQVDCRSSAACRLLQLAAFCCFIIFL